MARYAPQTADDETTAAKDLATLGPRPTSFPMRYEETYVSLIAVNPQTLFAFWEIRDEDLRSTERMLEGDYHFVLRLYDVTWIIFDGGNAHGFFDVTIEGQHGKWYTHPAADGRSLIGDVGLRTPDGGFLAVARSNCVRMPCAGPTPSTEPTWLHVEGDPRARRAPGAAGPPPTATQPGTPSQDPVSALRALGVGVEHLVQTVRAENVAAFYTRLWKGE